MLLINKIKYTIAILMLSCAPQLKVMEYKKDISGEKIFEVIFDSQNEAKRVQRRISKAVSEPKRTGQILELTPEQIEANRRIFKNRGYIKEKYKEHIKYQL
jgi:hypothetical protein